MLMRVIGIRPEMIVSVDVRDRMGVDVAAVEMREDVLVRTGVVPYERIDDDKRRLEIFCQKLPVDRPVSSTAASAHASAEALLAVIEEEKQSADGDEIARWEIA